MKKILWSSTPSSRTCLYTCHLLGQHIWAGTNEKSKICSTTQGTQLWILSRMQSWIEAFVWNYVFNSRLEKENYFDDLSTVKRQPILLTDWSLWSDDMPVKHAARRLEFKIKKQSANRNTVLMEQSKQSFVTHYWLGYKSSASRWCKMIWFVNLCENTSRSRGLRESRDMTTLTWCIMFFFFQKSRATWPGKSNQVSSRSALKHSQQVAYTCTLRVSSKNHQCDRQTKSWASIGSTQSESQLHLSPWSHPITSPGRMLTYSACENTKQAFEHFFNFAKEYGVWHSSRKARLILTSYGHKLPRNRLALWAINATNTLERRTTRRGNHIFLCKQKNPLQHKRMGRQDGT